MKKMYLFLLAALVLLPVGIKAQDIILSEGFENGIPSTWTQQSITGDVKWSAESGTDLQYPAGAYTGKGRAYLRNTTDQTLGFKTRLITPVMNLESVVEDGVTRTIYQPILRFSHAQVKWTADFDTLRVYYRTTQESDRAWTLLREYTRAINGWVRDEIELPQVNTTYQLAFEGSENMGRGIVLDSILVRSKPQCTAPHDLELFNMVDGGIDVQWLANYDATAFQFVVMEGDALEANIDTVDIDHSSLVVKNITKQYAFGSEWVNRIEGLEGGTTYTIYIRSICEGDEKSEWASLTFNMKNVKRIPYHESFNLPLEPGTIRKLNGWVMTGNTGNFNPHININLTGAESRQIVRTGTSLVFTGKNNSFNSSIDGAIPAGQYVYAATPELTGADLQDCQVSFWMTLGGYGCLNGYARGIIVGVMTDPQDLETFEPIDTVYQWKYATWEEYVVSLEKSRSGGKFVAFLSNFDQPNKLYIEDMTVALRPEVEKVQKVKAVPSFSNSVINYEVSWQNASVPTYNIIVATKQVEHADSLKADEIVKTYSSTTNSQIIPAADIESGATYYIYVQAQNGNKKGDWSNAYALEVTCRRALPITFGFEAEEGETRRQNPNNLGSYSYADCLQTFSTDPEYPYTNNTLAASYQHKSGSKGLLCLSKSPGREAWVVLPAVERIDTVELEFWMRTYSTSFYAQVTVGLMEDPADIETFEPVAVYQNQTNTYRRFLTSFAGYKGNAHFVAIRWTENPEKTQNDYVLIDDVDLHYVGECETPGMLDVIDITPTTATFTWSAQKADNFDVVISSDLVSDDNLDKLSYRGSEIVSRAQDVKTNSYKIEGMHYGLTHYAYVRSACDRDKEQGTSQWALIEFKAGVPSPMPLPYIEDFEVWGAGTPNYPVPAGWTKNSTGNYPYNYTSTTSTYFHSGNHCFYLYNLQSSTNAVSNRCGFAAMPKFDTDNVADLKLSFWAKASTAQTTAPQANLCYVDTLYIGVMTDPTDTTTFTLLKEVSVPTTTYTQYSVVLDNWQPGMGDYVTFTTRHLWSPRATNPTTGATGSIYNNIYIDDLEVESFVDGKPLSFDVTNVLADEIDLTWEGKATKGWALVATTEPIDADTLAKVPQSVIVKQDTTTDLTYQLKGLSPQKWYYIYLKPVASTLKEQWVSRSAMTLCLPLTPTKTYIMDFEFLHDTTAITTGTHTLYMPECWTAYNTSPTATTTYIPGIYRYGTTANISATSYCRPGGRKSLDMYSYYAATATVPADAVVATPEIKVNDMASLYVSFWYKQRGAAYAMQFGVMTDPDDVSTFTELAVLNTGNTSWTKLEYVLGDLGYKPEMGNYVAWIARPAVGGGTSRYSGAYIDDIQMYEQTCKAPQVNLTTLTDSSIVVLTGMSQENKINIMLFKDTVVDALALNDPDKGAAYIKSFADAGKIVRNDTLKDARGEELLGLEEYTDYTIALQMQCDEGEASVWALNTFTTLCNAKALSYFEKFDFERPIIDGKAVNIYNDTTANLTSVSWAGARLLNIDCWILGNKGINPQVSGYAPYVVNRGTTGNTTCIISGDASLKFYSTSTYDGAYAIMPAIDVDDITKYQVTFKGRTNGGTANTRSAFSYAYANGIIVGIVSDPSDLSTFVAMDTLYVQDTAVHKLMVRFDKYKGDANNKKGTQVAFMSEFAKTNVFFIDDIEISTIDDNCQIPLHLRAYPEVYSAKIEWEAKAESFEVYISKERVADDKLATYQWAASAKTNNQYADIKDLEGATSYYAYIKSVCGSNEVWTIDPIPFTTDCPEFAVLPYVDNFDRYPSTTSSHPNCWTPYYNGLNKVANPTSTIYPYVSSSANKVGSGNGLLFSISSTYNTPEKRPTIASPTIPGRIASTMLTFDYRSSSTSANYTSSMIIGLASDVSSLDSLLATLVAIDSITIPSYNGKNAVWYTYQRELAEFAGENMHVVLISYQPTGATTQQGMYVDNFKIETIPTCFVPTFTIGKSTRQSVALTITPAKEKDAKWDILAISEDLTDTVQVTVTEVETSIGGLKGGTTYNIQVRTNCGDGDVSNWSDPQVANTKNYISGEAFYGFENTNERTKLVGTSTNYIPADLESRNFTNAGVVSANTYLPYNYQQTGTARRALTGVGALQFYNYMTTNTVAHIVLPEIAEADTKQLRFSLRAGYVVGGDSLLETNTYKNGTLEIGYIDAYTDDLETYVKFAEVKPSQLFLHEKVNAQNHHMFDEFIVPLPKEAGDGKQVVLKLNSSYTSYLYMDDLYVEKKTQNVLTPKFSSSAIPNPTTLTLNWEKNGAEKWNVYVIDATATVTFPLDSVAEADIVASKKDVTDTTVTFTGLKAGARYFAYLQLADQKGLAAASPRRLEQMPNDYKVQTTDLIDFEEGLVPLFGKTATAADTAYKALPNWYYGNKSSNTRANQADVHLYGTYYASNLTSTSYQYMRYSHNDNNVDTRDKGKAALRLYSTAAAQGAYAVMPQVNSDRLDTLQLNFWARPFWGTNDEKAPKVGSATSTYSWKPIIVGTVTDPNDISTFEYINEYYYSDLTLTTSTLLFDDADQWYEEFQVPLEGTEGKYIVFLADTVATWFIDDISFSKNTCFTPTRLSHHSVASRTATLTWTSLAHGPSRVQIATGSTFSQAGMVLDTLVEANKTEIDVDVLQGSTNYYWRVRTECDGDLGKSKWSRLDEFMTDCPAITAGTTFSFEDAEGLQVLPGSSTSASYYAPICWHMGSNGTTASSSPYSQASSGTTWYSHATDPLGGFETNMRGLRFYNNITSTGTEASTTNTSWAIMPEIDGALEDMELSFYMLAAAFNPQSELLTTTGISPYYTHILYVGTLTDFTDLSTLTIIDTVRYDRYDNLSAQTVANQANDYTWQKKTVSLEKAKGQYIVFFTNAYASRELEKTLNPAFKTYLENNTSTNVYNYVWIDDVALTRNSSCPVPTDIKATNITKDAALITWKTEASKSLVKVYTSSRLTDESLVVEETVEGKELQLKELKAFTDYYVTVQADCSDVLSDLPQTYEFHTLRVPKVAENFIANVVLPTDWARGTGRASEVFAGKEQVVEGTSSTWLHATTPNGENGWPHQYMTMYNTTTTITDENRDSALVTQKFGWMISPAIVLDEEHDAWLTFAALMTYRTNTIDNVPDLNGRDDQFMVIISDDEGKTWKRENATIWNNETGEDNGLRLDAAGKDLRQRNYWYGKGDYVLNDLPSDYRIARQNPIQIDLGKYKGKTIKIAFYVESTLHNAQNYLRVGQVNVNYYVTEKGTLTNCQYNEFNESDLLGFELDEDHIDAGEQHFERIVYAPALDADLTDYTGSFLDTLYVLDANILSAPTYTINATICEGETYTDNNFIARTTTGVYKQKGICTETGCDSITVLNLTVTPRVYTMVEDTICEGQEYNFNGKIYTQRAIVSDTLVSAANCDSIVTLYLEVIEAQVDKRTAQICTGQTYYLSDKNPALSETGHYLDTLLTADGCKLIIDLDLTVADTLRSTYEIEKCAGSSVEYQGQSFLLAGVYDVSLKTAAGCDSIITVTVTDIPSYSDTINAKICLGETYTENGFNTNEEGQHKLILQSAAGCDSVVVLNLKVVIETEEHVDTTITTDQLPYFYGNVTYPIGTPAGVYYDTISDGGVCGSTLYHKLTITLPDGVANITGQSLTFAPSVITIGESVKVIGQFSTQQLHGMKIEVFDMVGKRISEMTATENPIVIDKFYTTGIYTVRIVTGQNELYIGRVVVH